MATLSATQLFGQSGVPIAVRDYVLPQGSLAFTAEAVKVVFAFSGSGQLHTGGEVADITPGAVFTVPAGQECGATAHTTLSTAAFYVHEDYLRDQVGWLCTTHPVVHQLRQAINGASPLQRLRVSEDAIRLLRHQLGGLVRAPRYNDQDFARLWLSAQVFDTVGRFAGIASGRTFDAPQHLQGSRPEVLAAIEVMRSDLSHRWRAEGIAREVALSASQLNRLFRLHLGVSLAAYLFQLRADKMAELLVSGNMNVAEAGKAVGWSDPAVASRAFKRRYGSSPRDFAATVRADQPSQRR